MFTTVALVALNCPSQRRDVRRRRHRHRTRMSHGSDCGQV